MKCRKAGRARTGQSRTRDATILMQRARKQRGEAPVLRVAALAMVTLIFLTPFFWLISDSFKTDAELHVFPPPLWPAHPSWDNYAHVFQWLAVTTGAGFGLPLWNGIELAGSYALLTTLTSAMVGFAFARLNGWGKRPLFALMLAMIMLPQMLLVMPQYVIYSKIGLINTPWPWVLMGLASTPFLSFLFRQFFAGIPLELEEAAVVDGCGYGRIFAQIFLPLSKPVLAVSLIISFQSVWGDYFMPSLFLNSAGTTTLAVNITQYLRNPAVQVGAANFNAEQAIAAGSILVVLPVLLLFFLGQRLFVQGIVTTGLKG